MENDPHGVGAAAARFGDGARRSGRVALAVLGAVLDEGDVVTVAALGQFRGVAGVVALVGDRLVLVNDRQWKPDVLTLPVTAGLTVHGWQDDRTASLTFGLGDRHEVVDRIGDRALAIELAHRTRRLTGAAPEPTPPPPPPAPAGPSGDSWASAPPPPPPRP